VRRKAGKLIQGNYLYLSLVCSETGTVSWKVGVTSNLNERAFALHALVTFTIKYYDIQDSWADESWILWRLAEDGMRRYIPGLGIECIIDGAEQAAMELFIEVAADGYATGKIDRMNRWTKVLPETYVGICTEDEYIFKCLEDEHQLINEHMLTDMFYDWQDRHERVIN